MVSTACSEMVKLRKTTKNNFNWNLNISRSTAVKASRLSVTASLDLRNSYSKFGILSPFYSEMLKVRKTTKNDLKWRANVSKSTAGKVSKFCVTLNLDLGNPPPRLHIPNIFCSDMLKVRRSTKNELRPKNLMKPSVLNLMFHA